MILALCLGLAHAVDTAARPHTAATLAAGEGTVRLPTGRTHAAASDHDTLWITPFDLTIGGPRLGVEHGGELGALRWSLSPSVGVKTTLRRASARLETTLSTDLDAHQLSLQWGLDGRFLKQLSIDDDLRQSVRADRLQSHLLAIWDTRHARVKARLPLADRGQALSWGSASAAWVLTTRRVYLSAGVGLMVGHPYDQYTLGRYTWWFWQPYPDLDVAVRF